MRVTCPSQRTVTAQPGSGCGVSQRSSARMRVSPASRSARAFGSSAGSPAAIRRRWKSAISPVQRSRVAECSHRAALEGHHQLDVALRWDQRDRPPPLPCRPYRPRRRTSERREEMVMPADAVARHKSAHRPGVDQRSRESRCRYVHPQGCASSFRTLRRQYRTRSTQRLARRRHRSASRHRPRRSGGYADRRLSACDTGRHVAAAAIAAQPRTGPRRHAVRRSGEQAASSSARQESTSRMAWRTDVSPDRRG